MEKLRSELKKQKGQETSSATELDELRDELG